MTPLQIQMLLHYHCSPAPFSPWGSSQSEAMDMFRAEGLVNDPIGLCAATLTKRGEAYVKFLTTMPLPVANWSIPGPWNPSLPPSVLEAER